MLKRYCAWHKKYFGKELVMGEATSDRDGATHGICDDCRKLVAKEIMVKFGGQPDEMGKPSQELSAWSSTCPKCGHHKLLNRNYCFKCEKAILLEPVSPDVPL